jgi:hypothetical protein
VLAVIAVVASLTALQRAGAVSLSSLAASPREVADGRLWLLVSSGAIAADPLLWSLLSFCCLALLTLAVCGWRILWLAALAGQTVSALLGYSIIGVARLVDPGAFQRLVTAPDYGVSAICAAWLGAVAGTGWQKRGESIRRAAIVLGCVAAASLAWFVRGRGLDVLDSEHVFAFGIGVAAETQSLSRGSYASRSSATSGDGGQLEWSRSPLVTQAAVRATGRARPCTAHVALVREQVTAFDEREGRASRFLGGALGRLVPTAEAAVEEQHCVTVGGGLDRCGQLLRGFLTIVGYGADTRQKGVGDRLLGRLHLGMTLLVEPGLEQHLEERTVGGGEPNVRPSGGGQTVRRRVELGDFGLELCREELIGVDCDRREELVAVGEMRVGGTDSDTDTAARLGEREVAHPVLADQLDRGIDQRRSQVAVVVAAGLTGSRHRLRARARCDRPPTPR